MGKLDSVIEYLCALYPFKDHLSNARLTKMVFLADWESAKAAGRQITGIRWDFNRFGPYVDDVTTAAEKNEHVDMIDTLNVFGAPKTIFRLSSGEPDLQALEGQDLQALKKVVSETQSMFFNEFIDHVYSTYPIKARDRYEKLDLVSIAREKGRLAAGQVAVAH